MFAWFPREEPFASLERGLTRRLEWTWWTCDSDCARAHVVSGKIAAFRHADDPMHRTKGFVKLCAVIAHFRFGEIRISFLVFSS